MITSALIALLVMSNIIMTFRISRLERDRSRSIATLSLMTLTIDTLMRDFVERNNIPISMAQDMRLKDAIKDIKGILDVS